MAASLGLFALLVGVLAWQMRAGHDPSLSAVRLVSRRELVVRRIERVVVISRVIEQESDQKAQRVVPVGPGSPPSSITTQVAQAPGPAAPSSPAPVSRTSGAP